MIMLMCTEKTTCIANAIGTTPKQHHHHLHHTHHHHDYKFHYVASFHVFMYYIDYPARYLCLFCILTGLSKCCVVMFPLVTNKSVSFKSQSHAARRPIQRPSQLKCTISHVHTQRRTPIIYLLIIQK